MKILQTAFKKVHKVKPPDKTLLVKRIHKVHRNVDEALNMISINSNVIELMIHTNKIDHYQHTLSIIQNDFSVVTKLMMASKILNVIFEHIQTPKHIIKHMNRCRQIVTIYTPLLLIIIFMSEKTI